MVIIVVVGLLSYSNTFHVPFQWDDKYTFLTENPFVKDLSYFLEPSKAKDFEQYGALKGRYIGYLTFALNYRIHGLSVTGYHIVNLAVHILNAFLVYLLVMFTFRTPFLKDSSLKEHYRYIALFTGLLFVSHPIQTEAVTYIFQRLTSLMSLFYLLSLVTYIKWRLGSGLFNPKSLTFFLISLASAVLAMKTKENAFTLPFVITLFELLFFTGPVKSRLARIIPFLLTLLIIPVTLISGADRPLQEVISGIGAPSVSRQDYFFTELRVITTYIRLLFVPVNQNIDYDYPVYHSLFDTQVFLSFLFFLFLLGVAVYLFFRSRFKSPASRLIAFGIFWFFITLSIESSIIALPTLINEYRLYLPSAGAFLSTITGAFLFLGKINSRTVQRAIIMVVILSPLVLSYAAYARNSIWRSEISLWEDVVRKSPNKARPWSILADRYRKQNLPYKALPLIMRAIELDYSYVEAWNNLGVTYLDLNLPDKAVPAFKRAIELNHGYAKAWTNLGVAYLYLNRFQEAVKAQKTALTLKPGSADIHYNLGVAYHVQGQLDKAIKEYKAALKHNPYDTAARYNLKLAWKQKNKDKTGKYKPR